MNLNTINKEFHIKKGSPNSSNTSGNNRFEKAPAKDEFRLNELIRVPEIRLIDEEENQVGIVKTSEALLMAKEKGLDLVELSPNAKPPVCKIVDYGKFKFDRKKKLREQKKKQKVIHIKEVKFRPKINEHDYSFKLEHIKNFLEHGDKVKVTMMFRGREIVHSELGMQVMVKVREELKDLVIVEKDPKIEGRNITMFIAPAK